MPVERLGFDRGIGCPHRDVVAERRDHARTKCPRELRQRRDVEMVVVAVRHQHDIDPGQFIECDAGIVVPLRPGEAERRGPHRPDRIEQDVEARGLDQPAGMADKAEPHLVAFDAGRRRIGMGARRPFRPDRALPAAPELPAQHFTKRFRRRAVRIEEVQAVEMIGHGAVVGFHGSHPDRGHADCGGGSGQGCKKAAAGDQHAGSGIGGRLRLYGWQRRIRN